jgi:signal transduction histidine kinase
MNGSLNKSDYFQALKAIKQHSTSFDGETHEFLKLALSEAKASLPACTLLFVKLEQFSPVYLPLSLKPDEWTEKLTLAIKRQIKDSGYTSLDSLTHMASPDLAVQSSMIIPVENNETQIGALAAFSQEPDFFSDADNLFMISLAQIITSKLAQQDSGSVTSRIPAVVMAKKEWEQTVDSLGHVVCLLDKSGHIKRANRQIEKWQLGSVQSLQGRTIHQVFHQNCHDYDCSFLHDINKAWIKMSASGESHWETEVQTTGNLRNFILRKTLQSDKSKPLDQNSFAVLTVRQSSLEEARIKADRKLAEKGSDNLAAKEEERRHIAMELHDGIGQDLAVVKINLEGLRLEINRTLDKKTIGHLDKIIHRIRGSMEDVHRLSSDLHPRYLDSRSLPVALELLCRDLGRTYKDVTIKCDIACTSSALTRPLKLAIFRIAQEALNNALRHSQADTITVTLQQCTDQLELDIIDNGIGFDLSESHEENNGLGLTGIRERVKLSDGSVSISTNASKGTTISVTWPQPGNRKVAQSD